MCLYRLDSRELESEMTCQKIKNGQVNDEKNGWNVLIKTLIIGLQGIGKPELIMMHTLEKKNMFTKPTPEKKNMFTKPTPSHLFNFKHSELLPSQLSELLDFTTQFEANKNLAFLGNNVFIKHMFNTLVDAREKKKKQQSEIPCNNLEVESQIEIEEILEKIFGFNNLETLKSLDTPFNLDIETLVDTPPNTHFEINKNLAELQNNKKNIVHGCNKNRYVYSCNSKNKQQSKFPCNRLKSETQSEERNERKTFGALAYLLKTHFEINKNLAYLNRLLRINV